MARLQIDCVDYTQEMRAIDPSVYESDSWVSAVHVSNDSEFHLLPTNDQSMCTLQNSGLSRVFICIGAPGIDVKLMGQHNQDQHLRYRWSTILTTLDSRWIPLKLCKVPVLVCFPS